MILQQKIYVLCLVHFRALLLLFVRLDTSLGCQPTNAIVTAIAVGWRVKKTTASDRVAKFLHCNNTTTEDAHHIQLNNNQKQNLKGLKFNTLCTTEIDTNLNMPLATVVQPWMS